MPDKRPGRLTRIALSAASIISLALGPVACAAAPRAETTTITVAAVDFTQDMKKLIDDFEHHHPDTKVNFVFLPENELRHRVPDDIAAETDRYDAVTIGPYEAPIWASRGWLTRLDSYADRGDYDTQDFMPTVRRSLSYNNGLYTVPY